MTAPDRELRARLVAIIEEHGFQSSFYDHECATAILDDRGFLDDLCEYVARRINEERGRLPSFDAFVRGQILREARASIALDRGDDGTYSIESYSATPESDSDKPA